MRTPFIALAALLAALSASAAPVVVAPFPAGADYIAKGTLYGTKTGTHRSVLTTRFEGGPAIAHRPLSVHPDASLNGELARTHADRLGPRALPPVFGGYSMIVHAMKEPTLFTARAQFHDGPAARNDFLNLNVYVENNRPQPAGLEFSFTGAWLFPAGDSGAPAIVPLDKIADVSFFTASQRPVARLTRVLARDADTGDFYASEKFATENSASLPLAGVKWARLDANDLASLGEYKTTPFRRLDHLGVYVTIPVTELTETVPAYGVICNVVLHSLEYTLLP